MSMKDRVTDHTHICYICYSVFFILSLKKKTKKKFQGKFVILKKKTYICSKNEI